MQAYTTRLVADKPARHLGRWAFAAPAWLQSHRIANSAVEHGALHGHRPELVEANRLDGCDRHIDLGGLALDQPSRQLLSHGGCERDAAAIAAEIDHRSGSRFMHVRVVIGGDREAAVPAVG